MNNTTNKEVNRYDRILCILLALSVVSLLVIPCIAHADELDFLTSIIAYEDEFREGLITANSACNEALNDSSLSNESKAKIRAVLALQELALRTMPSIYGTPTNPILPESDTVTFSGSGASGVYKSRLDGNLHYISCSGFDGFSGTLMSSDEFTVNLSFARSEHQYTRLPTTFYNISSGLSFGVRPSGSCQLFYCNLDCDTSYFNDYTYYVPGSMNENARIIWYISSDPYDDSRGALRINALQDNSPFLDGYKVVAYSGIASSLPSGTVDTETPWDYYNDTLLPYMHNNYSDVTNNYYVFPNGYRPAEDPTEPPLFPFTQPWQNDLVYQQTETSISVINPTATDNSGSTFTETTIVTVPVTETSASYVPVYGFNVPLLPNLETVTATLPAETIPPQTAQKITDLWAFVKWILDESGMFPIFLALVSIGFVMFIIRFIGG